MRGGVIEGTLVRIFIIGVVGGLIIAGGLWGLVSMIW